MILNRAELEAMKMQDLKKLAATLGYDPSLPSETKDKLIARMLLESAKEPEQEAVKADLGDEAPVEAAAPAPVGMCTIEEVVKAVNPYILRGMKVYHNAADNTWLFRVKIKPSTIRDTNSGQVVTIERWRDDSGTLKQPLATIKRCASILMQNAPSASAAVPTRNPAASYQEVV